MTRLATKLLIGAAVSLPACSFWYIHLRHYFQIDLTSEYLSLVKHIAHIGMDSLGLQIAADRMEADSRTPRQTTSDKRKRQIFEGCICLIFPFMIMALHVIVQGHRFDQGKNNHHLRDLPY